MTHPFHPLRGQRFELLGVHKTWGEDRAFFRGPSGMASLPARWTDAVAPDSFVLQSAGRAFCRPADLLALARAVRSARGGV